MFTPEFLRDLHAMLYDVRVPGGPMPKGPKGQKRPADVIGNAVKVMHILTGEKKEDFGADVARRAQ